jgi:hypothetical protein
VIVRKCRRGCRVVGLLGLSVVISSCSSSRVIRSSRVSKVVEY